ncbi:MAG: alpha/beta fold hydrolase, partial [Alphaproteobacteria bacterium]|nr:alpha/beta fold hydrolase [Alphaproteobacteria bacterium]
MPRIQIGDCSLYYERHGMGFPVVFISGLGGFGSFWKDQVATFAKRFEVVTFDHRGIGQSDESRIGYTVDRMAADVVRLLDRLEIRRSHIVGHSTGGAIAQILAIEHPNRLASVVLSATWTKADAYFRRLFTLRKEILQRLGPSVYLQASTLMLYPSWWVARNNERLRHEEAQ